MNFYARFERLCEQQKLSPAGDDLVKLMHDHGITTFNRTTSAKWKANQNTPRGDFIKALADIFSVSTDYLLGRTEDITDHSKNPPVLTELEKRFLQALSVLDDADKAEVFQYMDFKAGQEKYKKAGETA